MTTLATVFRTLVGLFVDDGALALAIIVIVLLSWIFTALFPTCRSPQAPFFWSAPLRASSPM